MGPSLCNALKFENSVRMFGRVRRESWQFGISEIHKFGISCAGPGMVLKFKNPEIRKFRNSEFLAGGCPGGFLKFKNSENSEIQKFVRAPARSFEFLNLRIFEFLNFRNPSGPPGILPHHRSIELFNFRNSEFPNFQAFPGYTPEVQVAPERLLYSEVQKL